MIWRRLNLIDHTPKLIAGFVIFLALFLNYCTPVPSVPDRIEVNDGYITTMQRIKVRGGWFYNEVLVTNHFAIPNNFRIVTNR